MNLVIQGCGTKVSVQGARRAHAKVDELEVVDSGGSDSARFGSHLTDTDSNQWRPWRLGSQIGSLRRNSRLVAKQHFRNLPILEMKLQETKRNSRVGKETPAAGSFGAAIMDAESTAVSPGGMNTLRDQLRKQ